MRMWFWRSGLGPGPSKPGGGLNDLKGLAGPTIRAKKNAAVTNMVTSAQPTSGSSRRSRNLRSTATRYPARTSAHRMIEPSSADQRVATLNTAGVRLLPFSATKRTVKSRVMRARSMAAMARNAPAKTRSP